MVSSESQASMNTFWPAQHGRYEAKRVYDCRWSWPRKLSFLSSEEVQELPYEIQVKIFKFLFGVPEANKAPKDTL